MTKKFGFTLAEVLITLGIIGVVAAMTIPTLMNQTAGAEFKTGFKKAVSVLNQAITMNVALDGNDFGALTSGTGSGSVYSMINSRMNVLKTGTQADMGASGAFADTNNYVFFFNDGMAITFPQAVTNCTTIGGTGCRMLVDVNGIRKPNKLSQKTSTADSLGIYDQFAIDFYNQQIVPHNLAAKFILYN